VIFPGGGYHHLDWTEEGEHVAEWLNSLGVTAAILKYRVPQREGANSRYGSPMALCDALRAIRMLRSRADEWGVNAKQVGVIGFSAGGHLAAWTSTTSETYEPIDEIDQQATRPNFAVLVYPVGMIDSNTHRFDDRLVVTKDTPPTFITMATDDGIDNEIAYYRRLWRKGVRAELHGFAKGGHSYALRPTGLPSANWPKRCEEWMCSEGLLQPANGQ
jgi:acetyl esterase/lipase